MNKRNLAYQHKANTQPTFTPMHAGRLQRKSTCAQHIDADGSEKICQQMAIHSSMDGVPPIVYEVLRSPGQPLDPATHAFMEPRFGRDFSHVRVHTDAKAVESAQALNALAYTAGQNVVFGPGQFAPRTFAGKRLLAHELTHVIQARPSTQNVPTTLTMSVPDSATEQEAEHTAQNILSDQRTRVTYRSVQLQRQQDITEEERREFEEDRRRFAEAQAEHFQIVGRLIRRNILQQAGVESGTDVTTTDEALLVIRLWGLSIDDLVGALPQLGQSLSNQVSGSQEGSTLQNRQEALVNGLTPGGQQTFRRMLNLVRSEPFWAENLAWFKLD
jgi:hypothetical protein